MSILFPGLSIILSSVRNILSKGVSELLSDFAICSIQFSPGNLTAQYFSLC